MVRGTAVQHRRVIAMELAYEAAIEARAVFVGALSRPGVVETLQPDLPDRIVVADDRGRSMQPVRGGAELATVEQLAVREVYVGELDRLHPEQLRQAWRHATRQI